MSQIEYIRHLMFLLKKCLFPIFLGAKNQSRIVDFCSRQVYSRRTKIYRPMDICSIDSTIVLPCWIAGLVAGFFWNAHVVWISRYEDSKCNDCLNRLLQDCCILTLHYLKHNSFLSFIKFPSIKITIYSLKMKNLLPNTLEPLNSGPLNSGKPLINRHVRLDQWIFHYIKTPH